MNLCITEYNEVETIQMIREKSCFKQAILAFHLKRF